jgi:hypothetical protein
MHAYLPQNKELGLVPRPQDLATWAEMDIFERLKIAIENYFPHGPEQAQRRVSAHNPF